MIEFVDLSVSTFSGAIHYDLVKCKLVITAWRH